MEEFPAVLLVSFLVICGASHVRSDTSPHRYKAGDTVPLYANKVGPYRNPSETYAYYDLPFCSPDHVKGKKESLAEVLNGDRLVSGPFKLEFLVQKEYEVACRKNLTKEEVSKFRTAVAEDYYFQMYYDDLPFWGFIGNVDQRDPDQPNYQKYFLYTHIEFEIFYNKEHVIEITTRIAAPITVDLTEDKEVDVKFSYTVRWMETNAQFEKRMEKYSYYQSDMRIHWFSVMNSCLTVLTLLGGLIIFYLQVLKKDINKYANDEELADNQEETGWKNIHGDVFRYPHCKSLFAAAIGSGTQLLVLSVFIIMLGLVGVFYPFSQGTLHIALVVVYAITSGIAGYTAVSLYCQLEGTKWIRNLFLTGFLFIGPLVLTFCFLNTVAIKYRATAALPIGTVLVLFSLWMFGALPLLLLGGLAARHSDSKFQAPCRTTKCPREIPPQRWYKGIFPQMAVAGGLPFSVIYIELYYLFASIWGHRVYTLYPILFIVLIILLLVTAFVSVALTYSQLAAENHEWWWRSFLRGGSTGLFVFGYCLHYYLTRSYMSGFLQLSFFFGYMACICLGIFLMLGAVSFRASLLFVRLLYGSIKCE